MSLRPKRLKSVYDLEDLCFKQYKESMEQSENISTDQLCEKHQRCRHEAIETFDQHPQLKNFKLKLIAATRSNLQKRLEQEHVRFFKTDDPQHICKVLSFELGQQPQQQTNVNQETLYDIQNPKIASQVPQESENKDKLDDCKDESQPDTKHVAAIDTLKAELNELLKTDKSQQGDVHRQIAVEMPAIETADTVDAAPKPKKRVWKAISNKMRSSYYCYYYAKQTQDDGDTYYKSAKDEVDGPANDKLKHEVTSTDGSDAESTIPKCLTIDHVDGFYDDVPYEEREIKSSTLTSPVFTSSNAQDELNDVFNGEEDKSGEQLNPASENQTFGTFVAPNEKSVLVSTQHDAREKFFSNDNSHLHEKHTTQEQSVLVSTQHDARKKFFSNDNSHLHEEHTTQEKSVLVSTQHDAKEKFFSNIQSREIFQVPHMHDENTTQEKEEQIPSESKLKMTNVPNESLQESANNNDLNNTLNFDINQLAKNIINEPLQISSTKNNVDNTDIRESEHKNNSLESTFSEYFQSSQNKDSTDDNSSQKSGSLKNRRKKQDIAASIIDEKVRKSRASSLSNVFPDELDNNWASLEIENTTSQHEKGEILLPLPQSDDLKFIDDKVRKLSDPGIASGSSAVTDPMDVYRAPTLTLIEICQSLPSTKENVTLRDKSTELTYKTRSQSCEEAKFNEWAKRLARKSLVLFDVDKNKSESTANTKDLSNNKTNTKSTSLTDISIIDVTSTYV